MDKLEYRAVIRFLVLEGVSPCEIQTRMLKVYGDLSPSSSTIKKWAAEFKRGRTSIKDDPREGRPKCATTLDVVQKVSNLIAKDKRLKVREIADEIEVSTGSTFEILTKKLNMRKLFGHWITAVLTDEERENRKKSAETCLQIFKNNKSHIIENFITMGETWIHIYGQQQPQTEQSETPPTKIKKSSSSSEKILAIIFWDSLGILFSSYIKRNALIKNEYIINILENFRHVLSEKRPNRLKESIYFYWDSSEIMNNNEIVLKKLNELNFISLVQPKQSPDLSPSDYHLFPKLENFLQAKRPTTADEAIEAVEKYFHDLPQNNFKVGIEFLEKRLLDCISIGGNYVEANAFNKNSDFVTAKET